MGEELIGDRPMVEESPKTRVHTAPNESALEVARQRTPTLFASEGHHSGNVQVWDVDTPHRWLHALPWLAGSLPVLGIAAALAFEGSFYGGVLGLLFMGSLGLILAAGGLFLIRFGLVDSIYRRTYIVADEDGIGYTQERRAEVETVCVETMRWSDIEDVDTTSGLGMTQRTSKITCRYHYLLSPSHPPSIRAEVLCVILKHTALQPSPDRRGSYVRPAVIALPDGEGTQPGDRGDSIV